MLGEPALSLKSRLAARTGSHNRLTIGRISAVACCKHSVNISARCATDSLDISCLVALYSWAEHVGVGLVADSKEESVYSYVVMSLVCLALALNEVCALDRKSTRLNSSH